jgi:hypothetical protein
MLEKIRTVCAILTLLVSCGGLLPEKRRKAPAFRHGDIRRIPPQGGKCLHFAQNRDTIVAW